MIYTSLAVLALSASAAASPLSHFVHMHPHAAAGDARVTLTLRNTASIFQDVKVAGHSYTVQPNRSLTIKAPAGTVVYADSSTGAHHRGEVIAQLDAEANQKSVDFN